MLSRRKFIKALISLKVLLLQNVFFISNGNTAIAKEQPTKDKENTVLVPPDNLGCSKDGFSEVYKAQGGTAEENMEQLLGLLGGIENIIEENEHTRDSVILELLVRTHLD